MYSFRAHPMQNGLTIKHFNTVFGYFVNLSLVHIPHVTC